MMSSHTRYMNPRKHGLEGPLSRDQLGAIILYPILTLAFYLIAGFYVPDKHVGLILGIYTGLAIVTTACWFYVSLVDPSKPGGWACPCMKFTQSHSRYCASCRKSIPGLDHHCLWLNTCIGTRNYPFFFILAVSGTLQFAFQTLISILLLTYWLQTTTNLPHDIRRTVGTRVTFSALMITYTVLAGIAFLSFSSLCIFHSYLQTMGMGTYDWILSRRQQQQPSPSTVNRNTTAATTTTTAASRGRMGSNAIVQPEIQQPNGDVEMTITTTTTTTTTNSSDSYGAAAGSNSSNNTNNPRFGNLKAPLTYPTLTANSPPATNGHAEAGAAAIIVQDAEDHV